MIVLPKTKGKNCVISGEEDAASRRSKVKLEGKCGPVGDKPINHLRVIGKLPALSQIMSFF